MSNQYLKLRRSAVQGKVPDTASLDYGEIALNTYDGLAFMKKSGSSGEEIVTIGSTTGNFSGSFTGSLEGTASYATTASYAVFANDYIFTSSILEYYVDRRFTGGCEVTILADKTISSSNASYLIQLSASRTGDPNHPWPDPWSANLVASSSIAAGQSTSARIIVKTGNTYTYGSSVLTQNGDMTGSLTNNLQPDIAVSQSVYNTRTFDLITPNIEYYFEPSASLYNINKSWQQMLVNYTSSDWNIAPEFKITGQGKFVLVYGQSNGFIAKYAQIYAPRAEITLQADHMVQNMYHGWWMYGQKINVDVNKWWSYGATFLNVGPGNWPFSTTAQFDWPSQSLVDPSASLGLPVVNININELRWGQNQFAGIGPHANDYWAGLSFGSAFGGVYNININKVSAYTRFTDGMIRFDPVTTLSPTASNNIVNINIGYVSASRTNIGGSINSKSFRGSATNANYVNNYYKIHVDKFDAYGVGFGTSDSMNALTDCTVIISCNKYVNYQTTVVNEGSCIKLPLTANTSSGFVVNERSFKNNQIIVTGNYTNYASASSTPIIAWGVNNNPPSSYATLYLDNFQGYQIATQSVVLSNTPMSFVSNYSTASYVVIKDSLLYASGSNVISNTFAQQVNYIFNNATMNRDIPSTINAEGTFNISANLDKLIY